MFDWNEEELTNIIWGEAGESDDHTVPYTKGIEEKYVPTFGDDQKKEWKHEAPTKTDFYGCKLESSSNFDKNGGFPTSGFGMESWHDLSLYGAPKTDKDSMGTEVSTIFTGIAKYNSARAGTALLDKDPETSQNRLEDKEQGDFVDYAWANIGSFDDLDKIFSNDDPIFGHVSLGNADELWSSSKDVTNIPAKSFPLSVDSPALGLGTVGNTSEHFEIKTEYVQPEDLAFTPGNVKLTGPASHGLGNARIMDSVGNAGYKIKPLVKDQIHLKMTGKSSGSDFALASQSVAFLDEMNRQKKLSKFRKNVQGNIERKSPRDLCGNCPPTRNQFQQFESQFPRSTPQICQPSVLYQQRQLQGPESLTYQHRPNLFQAPAHGNFKNQYFTMPVLPCINVEEDKQLSGCELSPCNADHFKESSEASVKPLTMTPQEKIEKLRKRQQMQAMLAIKRQQEQFNHQISCIDHTIAQKCSEDNRILQVEGTITEVEDNLCIFPSLDPYSPVEQDDSNTTSVAVDDYSEENAIFLRLQDIIARLDIGIRLCIRDSLFRLAQSAMQRHSQSAMQRHCASDTSSTNKISRDEHEPVTNEEINNQNRYSRMPEVETETNAIDRTVAHLLFHQPFEFPGKHPETPESPASSKLPHELISPGLVNLSMGCLPEIIKNKKNFSPHGSKVPSPLVKPKHIDPFKNSPGMDTSENASNNDPVDGGAMEIEASL